MEFVGEMGFTQNLKKSVIASQCSHWRGNPFLAELTNWFRMIQANPFSTNALRVSTPPPGDADCHTVVRDGSQ